MHPLVMVCGEASTSVNLLPLNCIILLSAAAPALHQAVKFVL